MKFNTTAIVATVLLCACGDSDTRLADEKIKTSDASAAQADMDAQTADSNVGSTTDAEGPLDGAIDAGSSSVVDSSYAEDAQAIADATLDAAEDASSPIDGALEAGALDGAADAAAADTGVDAAADAGLDAALPDSQVPLTYEELDKAYLNELKRCEIYKTGTLNLRPTVDEFGRCTMECLFKLSCAELRTYACGTISVPLNKCFTACAKLVVQDPFSCGAQGGIWKSRVCDGVPDCVNGADEQDCPTFDCGGGEIVTSSSAQCDAFPDCFESTADEDGCAQLCWQ